MDTRGRSPRVSVLMPTFKQASFIRRALESLYAQTLQDWELIVVDDGSPDATGRIVATYDDDPRVRYHRLSRNAGLGAALNLATGMARGRYLAYLPSDDLYYADHLARLAALLDTHRDVYLAYAGLRWGYKFYGETPGGDREAGEPGDRETRRPGDTETRRPGDRETNDSACQDVALSPSPVLVQVMHRRDYEADVRWATRDEIVSDTLEPDFWRALRDRGAHFAASAAITCEWVEHSDQRHKIIVWPQGGLARYRRYYGIGPGQWLNWQPSRGIRVDERARYQRFAARRTLPERGGLKILLAGELGFNPERVLAFEERGHKLYGLWTTQLETWDSAGPFAYGNIDDIPYDRGWPNRVRAIRPDIIYALLNWQALPLIHELLDADLGIPLVFHFKEGPFICHERGLWPMLMRVLSESDGHIFISSENAEWFQLATDGMLDPDAGFILDGDPPKIDWFTDDWTPKLSAQDGAIHTVCTGRPLGLDPFDAIARAGIHVHFYGEHFQQQFLNWTRAGLATGFMHIHPSVEPADWVRELSQYDAAWFHVFDSFNGGDLRRANWDDLNIPARVGTYAAAGLPWILKDSRDARVTVQRLARQHDVGVLFADFADLADQLGDRARLARLTANMRAARRHFAFDSHADELIAFFRKAMQRHTNRYGGQL